MKALLSSSSFWVVVALVVVVGGCWSYSDKIERDKELARQQAVAKQNSEVAAFAARYRADTTWKHKLTGGDSATSDRIMTVELEKAWLTGRPIVFMAHLEDVATSGDGMYRVTFSQGLWDTVSYDTDLRLSLLADSGTIDAFIKQYPEAKEDLMLDGSIIVAAVVDSIVVEHAKDDSDGVVDIKTGRGRMVGIGFIPKNSY